MSEEPIKSDPKVVWARETAFPIALERYGWIDGKKSRHPCRDIDELEHILKSELGSQVDLVWTPSSKHCCLPEEVPELQSTIQTIRKTWALADLDNAIYRLRNFSIFLFALMAYMSFKAWSQTQYYELSQSVSLSLIEKLFFILKTLAASTSVGFASIAFLLFAFIPWYQAKKHASNLMKNGDDLASIIPVIRFETWLSYQKSPITRVLLVLLSLIFVSQIVHDKSWLVFNESIRISGLDKTAYANGDFIRLFTAPFLHGGIIHFVMNSLALAYLGKRLEVFARWPHLATTFLISMLVGGEFSARMSQTTSVGASGGLMGCLGFLIVFEILHAKLVPKKAYRRLLGGVMVTALIGLVGYRFVDNGAHLGGLLAGVLYAILIFTKSNSVLRPKATLADRICGIISLLILGFSVCTVMKQLLFS